LTVSIVPVIVVVMQRPGRVLLVDEDPEIRLAIDRQLDELGWDAVVVNNGSEAARVVALGLVVDVLLIELREPELEGREVAWTICRHRPFTRVAFTGRTMLSEAIEPRDAPFLLKPCSTMALKNTLAGAIRLTKRNW
jgi:CheY-like chemotaxis protein